MRRLFIAITLLLLFGSASLVSARETLQGDNCAVESGTTLTGDVFVLCRILVVDGTIEGNLFGAALNAQIHGSVEGSVYLLAGQLEVDGNIGGDLHYAGVSLLMLPEARLTRNESDLITATLSTRLEEITIPGSITSIGYQLVQDGRVGRGINFWGTALSIDGTVDGDVNANVGDPESTGAAQLRALVRFFLGLDLLTPGLRVTEDGMINGQLTYTAPSEGEIAATLPNPPVFNKVEAHDDLMLQINDQADLARRVDLYLGQVVREFVSLALVGFILLLLIPERLRAPLHNLRFRPLPSLGVGLLAFLVSFPIFLIVILISVILILLFFLLQLGDLALTAGVVINVINLGSAGIFYFVAIFAARVVVCLAAGRFILRMLFGNTSEQRTDIIALLIGIALLAIAGSLPLVGWLINALAVFLGLGAILNLIQRQIERTRQVPALAPELTGEGEPLRIPPPIVDPRPTEPGMDNLPEGFNWWE